MTQTTTQQNQISVSVLRDNKSRWEVLTITEFVSPIESADPLGEGNKLSIAAKEAATVVMDSKLHDGVRVALEVSGVAIDPAVWIELILRDYVCIKVLKKPCEYEEQVTPEQIAELHKMSSRKLKLVAKKCSKKLAEFAISQAEFLSAREPSLSDALCSGIKDLSYDTYREGWVNSYRGEAILESGGMRWRVVGYGPRGMAEYVSQQGFVEFTPI